ncbi:hypothetical protein, partial [Citrobacter portucalensis]|uniref:hypothetical protein n=1 Tax=Citrobacter portucalensis TaxID=1639133 RepID=UPI002549E3BF
GGVFAFWVSQMNDCPRRYAQKNAAYRSASLVIKSHFGGVFAFWVSQMNDCPRRYAQKNAAYRSASLVIKPHFGEVFAFWAGAMPDGAVLIRPTGGETGFVGRIRCLHRHPAEVLQRALRLVFEDAGAYFLLI